MENHKALVILYVMSKLRVMQMRGFALPHGFLLLQVALLDVFLLGSGTSVEVVEQDHMHCLVQLELEHVENVKKCLKKRWISYSGSKGRNSEQDQVRMGVKQEGQMVKTNGKGKRQIIHERPNTFQKIFSSALWC